MEFQRLVRRRRMVRAYQDRRAVPAEIRDRLLDNALRAPSAGFAQGAAYVVLERPDDRARFWDATSGAREPNDWLRRMRQAPLLITCWCSEARYRQRYAEPDKAQSGEFSAPYWYVDGGMGALLILQTAVDAGLGACFFGIPDTRVSQVRQALKVPAEWALIGVVSVGYADTDLDRPASSARRRRRARNEVVHMGTWGS